MRKRPLCIVCSILIAVQVFLFVAGIREMVPATESFKEFEGKQVGVSGQIYRKEKSSNGQILYLKDARILHRNHRIKNIKITVYDKTMMKTALGNKISAVGTVRFFDVPRNFGNYDQKFYYEKQGISLSVFSTKVKMLSEETWAVREGLLKFREKCHQIVCGILGKEKGGMISGILLYLQVLPFAEI